MADISPFTPLRYDLRKIHTTLSTVISPPYDVISAELRQELLRKDPYNVVRLILPEGEGEQKYPHASMLLSKWQEEKVLVRESVPSFYLYEQTFALPCSLGKAQPKGATVTRRGFFGLVRLCPLTDRIILPHERTLSGPKEERLKLFRATAANLSPGFMLYRDPAQRLDSVFATGTPLEQFVTTDGVEHKLAKITNKEAIESVRAHMNNLSLLIADGHHRYETALRYREEVVHPSMSIHSEPHYFMVFLTNEDDPNLLVLPTHRLVHGLSQWDPHAMLTKAKALFDISECGTAFPSNPVSLLELLPSLNSLQPAFVMALPDGRTFLLTLKEEALKHPIFSSLHPILHHTDVAVLHRGIIEYILGITKEAQEAKTNLTYEQDPSAALQALTVGKEQVLFLMRPTQIAQVRLAAEAGESMPQKSTFFYPKIPTGLMIHTLDPHRIVGIS